MKEIYMIFEDVPYREDGNEAAAATLILLSEVFLLPEFKE